LPGWMRRGAQFGFGAKNEKDKVCSLQRKKGFRGRLQKEKKKPPMPRERRKEQARLLEGGERNVTRHEGEEVTLRERPRSTASAEKRLVTKPGEREKWKGVDWS